jgi:hypothetical protein
LVFHNLNSVLFIVNKYKGQFTTSLQLPGEMQRKQKA